MAQEPSFALRRGLLRVGKLSALARLLLAGGLAGVTYLLLPAELHTATRLVGAWVGFALVLLVLMWAAIVTAEAAHIRGIATAADPGRVALFVLVLVGACASLLAVVVLLGVLHSLPAVALAGHVALTIAAVALAWLLMHTTFTLRYAHVYYDPATDGGEGGLDFPGGAPDPDYLDFAYFAFVVGMTAQTADVSISGRILRRLALLHGLLSFGFNTAVVALAVSGVASVL